MWSETLQAILISIVETKDYLFEVDRTRILFETENTMVVAYPQIIVSHGNTLTAALIS